MTPLAPTITCVRQTWVEFLEWLRSVLKPFGQRYVTLKLVWVDYFFAKYCVSQPKLHEIWHVTMSGFSSWTFISYLFIMGHNTRSVTYTKTAHLKTVQHPAQGRLLLHVWPLVGQMDTSSCCSKAPVRAGGAVPQDLQHNFLRTDAGGVRKTKCVVG